MSGVISAAFTLANILFGVGGVSVGDFTALGLETPERMQFGGSQRTAVHHLLGGARVIDLLGPDEADITWGGYFSGPDAADRARQVDIMRQSGDAVPLSWPGDSRTVIITEFKCSYERGGYLLPYSITCMVVPDIPVNDPGQSDTSTQVSYDASAGSGVGSAAQTEESGAAPTQYDPTTSQNLADFLNGERSTPARYDPVVSKNLADFLNGDRASPSANP